MPRWEHPIAANEEKGLCQAHFRPQFILIGITASRADDIRTPLDNFNAPPEHGKPTGITETHFKPPPALGLL